MFFPRSLFDRLILVGLGAMLLAGCARGATPVPAAPDGVLPAVLRSSVQIVIERSGAPFRWGSGVAIGAGRHAGSECLILTAGHTMAGLGSAEEIFVLLDRHRPDPVRLKAQVVAAQDNADWDLALLSVHGQTCPVAAAGESPSLGEAIWVVGFPHGGEMTVGRGIVSQVSPARGGARRFTVDASTSHGSSGAGVFEARTGRLIGIVEAFGTARVPVVGNAGAPHIDIPMPGMTYVTPVNRIDAFLRSVGDGPLLIGRQ